MKGLGHVSRMRIVVVEIAMFAVTGLRLVEKRLQRVARDLFWYNFSFLIYKYIHDGEEQKWTSLTSDNNNNTFSFYFLFSLLEFGISREIDTLFKHQEPFNN